MSDPPLDESLRYLRLTSDEKIKLQSQPFDAKKQCWVPDAKECFVEGNIESTKGEEVTVVKDKGEKVVVKKDDIQQMNPPKFEMYDDMANLTYLNDASVLHNLRTRYKNWLIYTYSGLFCVVINPFKRLPIYTMPVVMMYRGKKPNEVPPHLYAVSDNAYANMLRDRENQSMLITGESGAGKTENTKKVIQYFALVAAASEKPATGDDTGKFIRIHFGSAGKIAGCDIEVYLLEKSRVIFQQPLERNYHIFYQLCSTGAADRYHSKLTIDGVDDAEEWKLTDEAFDILGFTQDEKLNLFKCTAAIMHFGNTTWKQRPREEQAEADGTEDCDKVAHLLMIDGADLIKGLLKPRIKVGTEYVNKGQNKDQVVNSIGALSKSIYSRMFNWLVERVNVTLDVKAKRQYFIGVLDIAGFEIFEPMGILSILEEECIVPKASDKTFVEKLYTNHLGKHPQFGKPKPSKDKGGKGGGGKSKKGGSMQTISATHREQLNKLMTTLKQTHPHFVRCIIPNEIKTGGVLDSHLVLHQLQCNGVLEGIRICRLGLPNRMIYQEFKQRYSILAPNAIPKGFVDAKKASTDILKEIALNEEQYRLGTTKVFFKAGVLGSLEDMRDTALSVIISKLQSQARGYVMRKEYKKMLEQRTALQVVQRNIKKYLAFRNWGWWILFTKIKPLLSVARQEEELKKMEEEFGALKENLAKEEKLRKEMEDNNAKLVKEKNDLYAQLESERSQTSGVEEKLTRLVTQKADLEQQVKDLEERFHDEEQAGQEINNKRKKLEHDIDGLKKDIDDLRLNLQKSENECKTRENRINILQDEIAQQDESLAKLTREKKRLEEQNTKTTEQLQAEEDKVNHLNKLKTKLEQTLDELEDSLEREKKGRADLDKSKRKLETDLKATQSNLEEIERVKRELEENVKRKDQEIGQMGGKLEDEQGQASGLQKKIKELQGRIQEMEEEIETERQSKLKTEKQRADLAREIDEMNDRLEEAGGATSSQVEMNKKREGELAKLRRDLEEANLQHEATAAQLRKKHQDAVNEMGEQSKKTARNAQ
ncbi:unnamed protein product [Didymodactylos carnosus]|uniref:Myosin heavy chain n=1 Tax=Didymodactylos carnosus TaxID=1234261 RepID=A0A8S2DPH4_9BILA|nr:unnamed protein product [Didymodactylos carnosus]CAF3717793.1 unnamed protein product [Didymodactylos carnosus]